MTDVLGDAVAERGLSAPSSEVIHSTSDSGAEPRLECAWTRWQAVHVAVLVGITSCIVGYRLNEPRRLMFDEVHYVPDAREIWARGSEVERLAHPPWGKILIGLGTEVFGDNPVGWRIVPAMCGVVIVISSYFAARSLTGRHGLGLLVGSLVMFDGLIVVMSRIAMLDIIAAAHIALAFALVVEGRRVRSGGLRFGPLVPDVVIRHSSLVAAVLLGAAVATKWSAVPALVAIGGLTIVHNVRQSDGTRRLRALAAGLGTFVVVPVVVYIAAHGAWIANYDGTATARERCTTEPCRSDIVEIAQGFVDEQTSKIEFQEALIISHPDRSAALGWPFLSQPVLSYFESCGPDSECADSPGSTTRILGLGNIALWGASLVSICVVSIGALRRRSWAAVDPLVLIAAQWLPWTLAPNPGFLFYMTPVVPFMALTVGIAIHAIERAENQRRVALALAAATIAVFVVYVPLWVGLPLTPSAVDTRLFLERWR